MSPLEPIADGLVWRHDLGDDLLLIPARLAVDTERIFYGSGDSLVAVDQETGRELWRVDPDPTNDIPGFIAVTVDDTTAYVGDLDGLFALRSSTGDKIWASHPDYITTTPIVFDASRLYVPGRGTVSAVDRGTGAILWETFVEEIPATMILTLESGTLCAATRRRANLDPPGIVTCFSPIDGRVLWRFTDIRLFDPDRVAIVGNRVVAASTTGDVFGLDLSTGQIRWQKNLLDNVARGFATERDVVFTCAGFSVLEGGGPPFAFQPFCVAFRASDGEEMWRTPIRDNTRINPELVAGSLYAVDLGQLIRMDPRTGAITDRKLPEGVDVFTGPPLISGDRLFVPANRAIYAFKIDGL